jgi:DNA-binding response OmpR family regulator
MPKILVIENYEPIRANLLELLEAEEFKGRGAENGRLGVQLARDYLPDLILYDLTAPEPDRYDVLAELRRNPATAEIPLVFIIDTTDSDSLQQKMNWGEGDYLIKPFTRDELLTAIYSRLLSKFC